MGRNEVFLLARGETQYLRWICLQEGSLCIWLAEKGRGRDYSVQRILVEEDQGEDDLDEWVEMLSVALIV